MEDRKRSYVEARNSLIGLAVKQANAKCGPKWPLSSLHVREEQWKAAWDKAFHEAMTELVNKKLKDERGRYKSWIE